MIRLDLGLDKDAQTPNVADAFKLALMMGDMRLKEEKEGVAGDVYVLDASVATPTHFAKFTPTLVKKFFVCVQVIYQFEYFIFTMSNYLHLLSLMNCKNYILLIIKWRKLFFIYYY